MRLPLACILAGSLVLPAGSRGAEFVDDFEGGTNDAGWAYIAGFDTLEPVGGNPGWWLHSPILDTFDPTLYSAVDGPTPFTGDYRAANVSKISVDIQTLSVDFGDGSGFNVILLLRDTNGTPFDIFDDDFAYSVGGSTPVEGAGWSHYEFDVPSQSNDPVPAGWSGGSVEDCENFRPGVSWIDVMQSVDQVEFHYLHPCFFAIFQQWVVGADNLRIEYEGTVSVEQASWGGIKALYR
ncbi:MAG: hypothetical protein ACRDGR_02255 [bacterium]